MSGILERRFTGRDGIELAFYETGQGRPLVLIHGFTGSAHQSWIADGYAAVFAERGSRVIMPDLRGHGRSSQPRDAKAYPTEVLTEDGLALLEQLGLPEYDLCGYSLGARVVLSILLGGATPGRAILGGLGLDSLKQETDRTLHYRRVLAGFGTFEKGTREWEMESWIREHGGDPVALLLVLDTLVDIPLESLREVVVPTLVAVGFEDREHTTAAELAAALPRGRHRVLPGNHATAVAAFVAAAAEFLASPL